MFFNNNSSGLEWLYGMSLTKSDGEMQMSFGIILNVSLRLRPPPAQNGGCSLRLGLEIPRFRVIHSSSMARPCP